MTWKFPGLTVEMLVLSVGGSFLALIRCSGYSMWPSPKLDAASESEPCLQHSMRIVRGYESQFNVQIMTW